MNEILIPLQQPIQLGTTMLNYLSIYVKFVPEGNQQGYGFYIVLQALEIKNGFRSITYSYEFGGWSLQYLVKRATRNNSRYIQKIYNAIAPYKDEIGQLYQVANTKAIEDIIHLKVLPSIK